MASVGFLWMPVCGCLCVAWIGHFFGFSAMLIFRVMFLKHHVLLNCFAIWGSNIAHCLG